MIPSNQRSAIAALDAVRPVIARLDLARHADDVAADLIESWSAVETALRSVLGGSSSDGQALVSEVRQRGLLDYGHAHALLGFLAARDRVSRTDYVPTQTDVDAARSGFQAVEAALGVGIAADTATYPAMRVSGGGIGVPPLAVPPLAVPPSQAPPPLPPPPLRTPPPATAAAAPVRPTAYTEPAAPARRSAGPLVIGVLVALLLAAGGFAFLSSRRGGSALTGAEAAYRQGDRVAARRGFEQAATDQPKLALPHVYLARMARQDGDPARAFSELRTAVTLEPTSAVALREMGQYLLSAGQPGQAVNWFKRALEVEPEDRVAQGWMGCALHRQGQVDLASRFFQRAGTGDWSACQQTIVPQPMAPGGVPAGVPPGPTPP